MHRQFWSRFHTPAWAGIDAEEMEDRVSDDRFLRHWFRHGGRRGGRQGGDRSKQFVEDLFGRNWGDEFRNRRGDIKYLLLELLAEGSSHGYDLIKTMETRYGGFRRLSPGSVYPTLQMLEEGGYLTSEAIGGKRVYTITEEGRQLLAERTQQGSSDAPWDDFKSFMKGKPQEFTDLRNEATELATVLLQVARSGDPERMNRVRQLLEQVKREIYAILAEK
ncbi:PadR family transcriptional regulator [Kovacikia minuta CCNUW1]|uniref:PadR family transcriptional regulator n=1 Tax=Kovacikia minuta TaxID=2931930 RepID=UPI001CC9C196|nr:PadR family transcriptional regulator [Kovacikia minuta]UBF28487.1 PadR family transcriptional regulator [Kovacikia minuta CCNUW1]